MLRWKLEIEESGFFKSKYKINFQNTAILKRQFLIKDTFLSKSKLIFENTDEIVFARKLVSFLNPHLKIWFKGKEIGKIKMKLISLKRNYKIQLASACEEVELYSIVLFLCTESNHNFE